MMVVSANVASAGSSERPSNSDRMFDSNNSLDKSNLDDEQKDSSLKSQEYRIYSQFIAEKLQSVTESKNCAPFTSLLASLYKPGFDDYGNRKPIDYGKLTCVVRVISKELGRMDQQAFIPIIMKVLDFPKWSVLHPALTSAYIQFFNVLVSVNPKWWIEVANKIIRQFSAGLEQDFSPHHLAIKQIMQNVPIASTSLSALFSEHFPHKSCSSNEIQSYVKQLLLISDYAPDQAAAIWRLIIGRLIELDVECTAESDDESDSESDSDIDDLSDASDFSDSDDSDAGSGSNDESDEDTDNEDSDITPPSKRIRLDEVNDGEEVTTVELDMASQQQEPMRQKVDNVLSLVLEFLSHEFTHDKIVRGEATPLFNILLLTFKEIVLPTSRPQSVQFLWFYIVHGHTELMASFVSVLLETAMSRDYSVDQRCRALQYVASFVARAKGLSRQQIVFVVSFLASWVRRYIREREVEVDQASSMAKFKVLYSAVQALFYIFVFRHSMLRIDEKHQASKEEDAQAGTAVTPHSHTWEADLDKLFPEVINTKFNPLQYCQPDVVAMFARIAQNEEVASCYSIIERNRWGKFRGSDMKTKTGASFGLFDNNRDNKLYDSFFPFQPLRLKKAKLFIGDIYEKWSEQDALSESESDYEN